MWIYRSSLSPSVSDAWRRTAHHSTPATGRLRAESGGTKGTRTAKRFRKKRRSRNTLHLQQHP